MLVDVIQNQSFVGRIILRATLALMGQTKDKFIQELRTKYFPKGKVVPMEISIGPFSQTAGLKTDSYLEQDEWTDIQQSKLVELLKNQASVQVPGYVKFHKTMYSIFPTPKNKNWRFMYPETALAKVREIIDRVENSQKIDLIDIHAMNLYLYYLTYNAVHGTRVRKQKKGHSQ